MKTLKMPHLSFKQNGKTLIIPGGWSANCPVIEKLDAATLRAYGRFLQTEHGLDMEEAEAETYGRMQKLLEASWTRHLQESLKHYARRYAKYHPERITDEGLLSGFDPVKIQRAWMPQENTGRRGKEGVERLFDSFLEEGAE